ncbi:MAG: hypothetical protein ACU0DI_17190 [Paracoccaceae bacterium]
MEIEFWHCGASVSVALVATSASSNNFDFWKTNKPSGCAQPSQHVENIVMPDRNYLADNPLHPTELLNA